MENKQKPEKFDFAGLVELLDKMEDFVDRNKASYVYFKNELKHFAQKQVPVAEAGPPVGKKPMPVRVDEPTEVEIDVVRVAILATHKDLLVKLIQNPPDLQEWINIAGSVKGPLMWARANYASPKTAVAVIKALRGLGFEQYLTEASKVPEEPPSASFFGHYTIHNYADSAFTVLHTEKNEENAYFNREILHVKPDGSIMVKDRIVAPPGSVLSPPGFGGRKVD